MSEKEIDEVRDRLEAALDELDEIEDRQDRRDGQDTDDTVEPDTGQEPEGPVAERDGFLDELDPYDVLIYTFVTVIMVAYMVFVM